VVLGVLVLGERLNRVQWSRCTGCGRRRLPTCSRQPPWIALVLAFSFGLYGLIRKVVTVRPSGLATETLLLLRSHWRSCLERGAGRARSPRQPRDQRDAGGPRLVTALPLALFAFGARGSAVHARLVQYLGRRCSS